MKPVYKCEVREVRYSNDDGHPYMVIKMLEAHIASGIPAGWHGQTSRLLSMDFQSGVAITTNSIYVFEVQS